MKYLGIDYGSRRIGLAISDSGGHIATAYGIVDNDADFFRTFIEIIKQEGVQALVVGQSHDMQGNPNTIQKHIDLFVQMCRKDVGLPIHMYTEIFSSMQAKWGVTKAVRRSTKSNRIDVGHKAPKHIDAGAAAVVLQSFLDSTKT